jgi:hypothetical protein
LIQFLPVKHTAENEGAILGADIHVEFEFESHGLLLMAIFCIIRIVIANEAPLCPPPYALFISFDISIASG